MVASTRSSDSRVPGVARTSLRMLGSKETVPPRAWIASVAVAIRATMAGVDMEEPMTCRWSAEAISASVAGLGAMAPAALWAML